MHYKGDGVMNPQYNLKGHCKGLLVNVRKPLLEDSNDITNASLMMDRDVWIHILPTS